MKDIYFRPPSTVASRILANGIPKSGTYFLDALVRAMGWSPSGVHLTNEGAVIRRDGEEWSVQDGPIELLPWLPAGQFANGHVHWTPVIEAVITAQPDLLHVLIYRDPRDTIVSMMRWQTYGKNFARNEYNRARQSDLISRFSSDEERLTHFILQIREFDFAAYAPWLRSNTCYAVRFEDLYAELVDCQVGPSLSGLLNFFSVNYRSVDIDVLRNKALHTGITSSGAEKKIGVWRDVFTQEHLMLLDYPKFTEGLQALGYA